MPRTNFVYAVFICYIVFFFPLIATLNQVTNQTSNWLSILYRASTFVLSAIIICREILIAKNVVLSIGLYCLIVFWLYYLFRLSYDLFILELIQDPSKSASYYMSQTIGISFINMVAFYYAGRKINFKKLTCLLYYLFAFINILFVINFLNSNGFDIMEYASKRIALLSDKTDTEYLNSITIGMYSGFFLILAMYARKFTLFHFVSIFCAVFNLLISASKGPFLSLVIIYLFFYLFKRSSITRKTIFKYLILAVLGFVIFNSGIFNNFFLFDRLMNREVDVSTSIRLEMFNNAFNQILRNPLFGTYYFVISDRSSPHNIFVDIILTTGAVGLLLIIYPLAKFLSIIYKNFKLNPIMAIAFFTFCIAQTSGYVYGLLEFWSLIGLVLAFPFNKTYS